MPLIDNTSAPGIPRSMERIRFDFPTSLFYEVFKPAIDKLLRHGVISEMLLGRAALNATKEDKQKKMDAQGFEDNHAYLRSKLKYGNNKVEGLLLDDKEDAVMMSWETKLMEEHARLICHNKGSVLNVGHGMGIVDGKIQVINS